MTAPRARILAIDDTPANLMTLGSALEGEFDLQFATSGSSGIALALATPPDLILLDVMMPEVDGYETYKRLLTQPGLKDIPVVFVTALNDIESEVTALSLGAADYITKPINVTIARHRIRNLVEREQLRRQVQQQRDQLEADVAVMHRSEDELRHLADAREQALQLLQQVANQVPGMVYQYRLRPDGTSCFPFASEAIRKIYGVSPQQVREDATAVFAHLHPDDLIGVQSSIAQSAQSLTPWIHEYRVKFDDGTEHWLLGNAIPQAEPEGGILWHGFITNITERKAMEEQVRQLAFYDSLTGLPNRRLLDDRLGQALIASKRSACYGTLMFLDLDNFKPLNDMYGHAVGDLLLIEVARRLSACVREMDTVARFGGDEFVVMISELTGNKAESTEQARSVAEKIRTSLAEPYLLNIPQPGKADAVVEHHCSASIGVVVFVNHEAPQADILKWGDLAMYQAKDAGRNAIRFYESQPLTTSLTIQPQNSD
jgi:diguanylate cyclase (GGDEF)-like protein/PAS domain S-box-containing protein